MRFSIRPSQFLDGSKGSQVTQKTWKSSEKQGFIEIVIE